MIKCSDCKFFAKVAKQCRIRAPVALMVGVHPVNGPLVYPVFPPILKPNEFGCGEGRPALEA